MSIPNGIGFWFTGEANVLSIIVVMLLSFASSDIPLRSTTFINGLLGDST